MSIAGSIMGWFDRSDGMDFLTVENRKQLRDLDGRCYEEIDDLQQKQARGALDAEGRARLHELYQQKRAELAAMLSPTQLSEYLYYRSDAADYVRNNLPPAKTEVEFRTMVRVAEEFGPGAWSNPREGPADSSDEYVRQFQEQKADLQKRLTEVLGEDRIAEQAAEEKARSEEEEQNRQAHQDQREREEFASMAEEAGVPPADFGRFIDRLKEREKELRPKFEEFEKSLTGTPLEKHEQMMAAVKVELDKIAADTLGANGPAMVQKLMEKIDREDRPQGN